MLKLFQLLKMNFINFFKETSLEIRCILNLINYFNQYIIVFAIKINFVENIINIFIMLFTILFMLKIFYVNLKQHFDNMILRNFIKHKNVKMKSFSFKTSRNTRMIKHANKLLKNIIKKQKKKNE